MSAPAATSAARLPAPADLVTVVGIGADGFDGLGAAARAAVLAAGTLVGSARQLDLVPPTDAVRRAWPSPLTPLLDAIADGSAGARVCVLASGDPMLHGIGATLARRLGPERLHVHPHPSAFALACARLGWPAAETELVSAVGRPVDVVAGLLQPGRRLVAYVTGADGAARLAAALVARGFGPSRFTVLEQLGGPAERRTETSAVAWDDARADPLHVVAVEVAAEPGARVLPRTPGLPDAAFDHDGQITKRAVRAVTLAALGPRPGELLWDVGAGSGSVAIEWLRAEPSAGAIAVEPRADRAARIAANARTLGVPRLEVVEGAAPAALEALPAPDVVFVGGGVSAAGVLPACWAALRSGGRIVANAVTLEGEQALHAARARHGGDLVRLEVAHAAPVGTFEAWRPQLPVVQWQAVKEGPQ